MLILPLRDENPTARRPYVTWALIGLNAAIFAVELAIGSEALDRVFGTFGVVPALLWADPLGRAYTLVTSAFLHGGWMHLIGNLWFLYVFGDNVEDRLGRPWFVAFYLASAAAASLLQASILPGSPIPTIGASGAIAGVLGAYALLYPRAQVVTLLWIFIFLRVLKVPALIYLGYWFVLQFFSGVGSLGGGAGGGVAWWAHIGGFVVGGAVGYLLQRLSTPRPPRRLRTAGQHPGVIVPFDPDRRRTYH